MRLAYVAAATLGWAFGWVAVDLIIEHFRPETVTLTRIVTEYLGR